VNTERRSYAERIMRITIAHLFEHPEFFPVVARWIHEEWWTDKPEHTAQTMEARLRQASGPAASPLSLVALVEGEPVGTVNLVENDDADRPHLSPWLAALLVIPEHRGNGIGSMLVRSLVGAATRRGVGGMYLGTDIPGFYARFGAEVHEQVTDAFCVMLLPVPPDDASLDRIR
jgi:predicted N-acetyltransferase YhbS